MPINISFQPPALAVGGLGLLGGLGEYAKWRTDKNFQMAQMQQQALQNAQHLQMQMAAMANQNQQRQQQNFFDLAKLPYQADIDAQKMGYQYALQGQNQAQLAQLQGQIHRDQSAMDQDERMRLLDATSQAQLGNQQEMAKYNDQIKQQQQVEALFQNPLQQHLQNVKTAQGSGYTFSPEQQQTVGQLKGDIQAIQDSVNDGTVTRGSVLPQLRQKVAQLNAIVPGQPPPQSVQQIVDQNVVMGVRDKDGNVIPGTEKTMLTKDKDGIVMAVRGTKPGGEEEPTIDVNGKTMGLKEAKARQSLEAQTEKTGIQRQKAIEAEVNAALDQQYRIDKAQGTNLAFDPTFQAQKRAEVEARFQQGRQGAKQEAAEHEARATPPAAPGAAAGAAPGGAAQPQEAGIGDRLWAAGKEFAGNMANPIAWQLGKLMPEATPQGQQPGGPMKDSAPELQQIQQVRTPVEAQQVIQTLEKIPYQRWSVREAMLVKQARAIQKQIAATGAA